MSFIDLLEDTEISKLNTADTGEDANLVQFLKKGLIQNEQQKFWKHSFRKHACFIANRGDFGESNSMDITFPIKYGNYYLAGI